MRNHDQKTKDMCESLLPSTSRKNAREKRRIAHGADRARERVALRGDHDDVTLDRVLGDSDGRRRAIHEMVWDRRAADKVAPLIRWADATVDRDPALRNAAAKDVIAYFAALLPDNLIDRHAIQHIEWGLGLDRDREAWLAGANLRRAERRAAEETERRTYRAAVLALVEDGRHGDVNRAVREVRRAQVAQAESANQPVDVARLAPFLAGSHAVDEFVAATVNSNQVRAAVLRIV